MRAIAAASSVASACRVRYAARMFSSSAAAAKDHVKILADHFSPAVPRSPKGNNIVVDHAKGSWIYSTDGKKYLDLQTGIGVANTGHCHDRVVKAVQEQVAKGIHLQQNCVISQPVVELVERLNKYTPDGISRFFFNCTGTEAVESAIKLARHETKKQNIITFKGGFHGRSLATLAMTSSKTAYGVNYGPLPSGIFHTAWPQCVHCTCAPTPSAKGGCCGNAIEQLKQLFKESTSPADTAAIVVEPIQGEGGYTVPYKGFLKDLRSLCDEHGIFLIIDEVQSGVGRTGKMWAFEHEGILPDIFVFAKGIASGMPLSGIATRPEYMKKSPVSSMGGTYGANAVSAAAAVATLDAIVEEGLLANATARGDQLQAGLRKIAAKHPGHILDIRGRGCMVGLEFAMPAGSGFAGKVTEEAMKEGLLLLTSSWREVIRFIPPLVITEGEMDTAIQMLDRAMDRAVATWSGPAPFDKKGFRGSCGC